MAQVGRVLESGGAEGLVELAEGSHRACEQVQRNSRGRNVTCDDN